MKLAIWLTAGALASACAAPATDKAGESNPPSKDKSDKPAPASEQEMPAGSNFQVLLTDAPGDFDEVWVDISSVEVSTGDDSWIVLAEEPQSFDLLTLQNDVTAALGDIALEPGHYGQLRLMVANAFVVVDGVSEDLKIASGAQSGIKLNLDTEILPEMKYQIVVDFDAHKSVKRTGGGWLMTPVIHIKDMIAEPIVAEEVPEEGGEDTGGTDDGSGGTDDGSGGTDDGSGDGSDVPVE